MSAPFLAEAYAASNARHLSPRKVAESFVPNTHFDSLLEPGHTLLVGPRGSGKTTLLKMLSQPALRNWSHPQAESVMAAIQFVGVYVPADIVWQKQIGAARSGEAHEVAPTVTHALMATNLFKSFCGALQDRIDNSLASHVSSEDIETLWTAVISLLQLRGVPAASMGVASALGGRFSELSNILLKASRGLATADLPDYCHIEPIPALGAILDLCDTWFRDGLQSWALCFDELEILDDLLREELMTMLRSTDQRFLLKLSVAPFRTEGELPVDSIGATLGHDYSVVTLWYPRPNEGGAAAFSSRVASAVLFTSLGQKVDPSRLLGRSQFSSAPSREGTETATYSPASSFWKQLVTLASKDLGLSLLLYRKAIDLSSPTPPSIQKRDQFFRKIKPTVLQRSHFCNYDGPKPSRKPRKQSDLYSGIDVFQRMCEGNPRWLIGVLKDLLREWKISSKEPQALHSKKVLDMSIPRHIQARVLNRASGRYRDFLRNWPSPPVEVEAPWPPTLYKLVDHLGEAFFERQVLERFPIDPKGTFVVDEGAPDGLLHLIRQGIVQGAFVDLDNLADIPPSPRGRRYRLSFLLSPSYKLLVRVLKSESLSSLLRSQAPCAEHDDESELGGGRQQSFLDD